MTMKQNQAQEIKTFTFTISPVRKDVTEKISETLRDIDVIVDKLQVNVIGFRNMFIADTKVNKATIIVGSVARINVDPVHPESATIDVNVKRKDIIETLDREISIDPDNYRVEVSFDNSGETLKVIGFRLNTKANIEERHKQNNRNRKPNGKHKFVKRNNKE